MRTALAVAALTVTGCTCFNGELDKCLTQGRCRDLDGAADGGTAAFTFEPASVAFGATPIRGHSTSVPFELTATTGVKVVSLTADPGFEALDAYTDSCLQRELNDSHGGCRLVLTYRPTAASQATGALHFRLSTDAGLDFPLTGSPVNADFDVEPLTPVVCAAGVQPAASHYFHFINTGAVRLDGIENVTAVYGPLTASAECFSTPLDPGVGDAGNCVLRVSMTSMIIGADVDGGVSVAAKVGTSVTETKSFFVRGRSTAARKLNLRLMGGGVGFVSIDDYALAPVGLEAGPNAVQPVDVPESVPLRLHARPFAPSGFVKWDAGACGTSHDCTVTVGTTDLDVGVHFELANLVFPTEAVFDGGFTFARADALCDAEAVRRNLAPSAYRALLVGAGGTLLERLGTARGFRTPAGAMIADTATQFVRGDHWNTVVPTRPGPFDDTGAPLPQHTFWTGVGSDCNGWMNGVSGSFGYAFGQGNDFTDFALAGCSVERTLLCVDTAVAAQVQPPPPALGRRAFITSVSYPVTADGNLACANEAADAGRAGMAFRAFRSGATSLESRFSRTGGDWYRFDEIRAAATTILDDGVLSAPLLVTAKGTPLQQPTWAWLGFVADGGVADCNGWQSTSGSGYAVRVSSAAPQPVLLTCGGTAAFMCFQP